MSNIPTGCKPFNYEEAIKDLSKITIDGINCFDNTYKITAKGDFFVVERERNIGLYKMDGTAVDDNADYDLFLKDETVVYVNVYREFAGVGYGGVEGCKTRIGEIKTDEEPLSICALTISNGEVIKTETVHKY